MTHIPTAEDKRVVQALASVGTTQADISKIIGISNKTLLRHYRHELDVGMPIANAKVAQSLYQQATGGNTAAAIFWLKIRAGWLEKTVSENINKNININHDISDSELDSELAKHGIFIEK